MSITLDTGETTSKMGGEGDHQMNFADLIFAELRRRNISLREFAELAGVDHSTLSTNINGKHRPSPATLRKVAPLVGRSEDELLTMVGHRSGNPPAPDPSTPDEILAEIQRNVVALQRSLERPVRRANIPQPDGAGFRGLSEGQRNLLQRIGAEPVYDFAPELEQVGSAGHGKGIIEGFEHEEYLPRPNGRGPRRFLLRVEGECLTPDVEPGDRVEFEPDASYEPGDLVVAVVDGEKVLIKHFDEVDNVQYLLPLNGDPLPLTENMRIVGVVKDIHRQPRKRRMGRQSSGTGKGRG